MQSHPYMYKKSLFSSGRPAFPPSNNNPGGEVGAPHGASVASANLLAALRSKDGGAGNLEQALERTVEDLVCRHV